MAQFKYINEQYCTFDSYIVSFVVMALKGDRFNCNRDLVNGATSLKIDPKQKIDPEFIIKYLIERNRI